MNTTSQAWAGPVWQVDVPATRDPLINAPLISLGKNREGVERFWISSWNSNSGALGLMVDEKGRERIYRFPLPHTGFYSAAPEDGDTLWLCGDLSRLVRLTLSSGEFESYETGAPPALVFQGMTFDRAQRKILAVAYPPPLTAAFSFDCNTRQTARVFQDVYENSGIAPEAQAHTCRFSFPVADGTHRIFLNMPGAALLHWDPRTDALTPRLLRDLAPETWDADRAAVERHFYGAVQLIHDGQERTYLPYLGWCDAHGHIVSQTPRPQREMNWFARSGVFAWGLAYKNGQTTVGRWNMADGEVVDLCTVSDAQGMGLTMSQNQKIVSVNVYGEFSRHDAHTGALEISRRLPTDAVGHVDCLCRIDRERLLGTPFISQRFWLANLETGVGFDAGRAAGGVGEVLLTWKINGKVYMASYTQGQLTEYDPDGRCAYPENPRLVAQPPGGMRPVAGARHGDILYYSCSYHYGHLGSVLTRFDTTTGEALYQDDPLPEQCIKTLHYHAAGHSLIGGSAIEADCRSCPSVAEYSAFVRLDADTLEVKRVAPSAEKSGLSEVCGPLDENSYLARVHDGNGASQWLKLDASTLERRPLEHPALQDPDLNSVKHTGKPGLFLWRVGKRFELWEMNRMERLAVLHDGIGVYGCHVQDDSVYLVTPQQVIVLEGCLLERRFSFPGKAEKVTQF